MKQIGSAAHEYLERSREMARAREEQLRADANGRDVHAFVSDEYGKEVVPLFPSDVTFTEFVNTTTDGALEVAHRRLKLCATCPPHGGACASEYEKERGKAPCWDREKGLRLEWCSRWSEHLLREKLRKVGVGAKLLDSRFATFETTNDLQRKAKKRAAKYAADFKRGETSKNLLITGTNFGIGKTHLAVSVLAELLRLRRLRNAFFTYLPEFLELVRRSYDEPAHRGLIDKASRTDLLVLDDLGAQRTTDWVREQMNLISNARWSNGLPTIMTTNTGPDEITATLGPRAASRMLGGALGVEVDGDDRRWRKQK